MLILGGSDTTSINLTWLLSLLLNNQHAQEELDLKVGRERWVEEHDINDLIYLQAIIKESLRLYIPTSPSVCPTWGNGRLSCLWLLHSKGYSFVCKWWKLHQDPRVWENLEEFLPERFLTSHANVDASGQHFEFIPFGSGRRSCPGSKFAFQVSHLTLACLLQGFEFQTPLNMLVDMIEGLSINLPRATPLEVLLTPRLSSKLYQI